MTTEVNFANLEYRQKKKELAKREILRQDKVARITRKVGTETDGEIFEE